MNFGEKITKAREANGLSRIQLACHLNVSDGYLGMVERGTRSLPLALAISIADFFKTTVNDLFEINN